MRAYADLPLHSGPVPPWLFKRMVKLSKAICEAIILEYNPKELLERLADPFFFQSFGCVVGFDWHSSGITTTLTAALKEALNIEEHGLAVCGGKGKIARETPNEIDEIAEHASILTKKVDELKYASKMAAKVDNVALQDCFSLYHHSIIFDEKGNWIVIQQGMNPSIKYARRYHWLGERLKSFVNEPHYAICCDYKGKALNFVAKESKEAGRVCVEIAKENPNVILNEIKKASLSDKQKVLQEFFENASYLKMPRRHWISLKDLDEKSLRKILLKTYETQVKDFEELLGIKGIGSKTLRSLALIAELIYGTKVSWRDPVKYAFALGGKDGHPYRVKRKHYDNVISILEFAVNEAKLGKLEKIKALKRLQAL